MSDASELKRAIRAITVDAVNDAGEPAPNGPTEQATADLLATLCELLAWRAHDQELDALLAKVAEAGYRLTGSAADDCKRLRVAAEKFWPGEDFRRESPGG
ncbi:MAG: hypothetical protein V3W41_22250 [Planctomycetota bacterium]